MLIGIFSDTHDNLNAIQLARDFFVRSKVEYVFHCGDLTDPSLVSYLDGCRVIYSSGNMDSSSERIRQSLQALNPHNWAGYLYTGAISDSHIACVHGNVDGQVTTLIQSQKYDYIFHGHTHQRRDERFGKTRVINPGALGGKNSSPGSLCTLDLKTGKTLFYRVSNTVLGEYP
jgi:uncharacterized protein